MRRRHCWEGDPLARAYDLLLRLVWGRKEDRYRAYLLELAQIAPEQDVLNVGCGTGTLAIAAKRLLGPGSRVTGWTRRGRCSHGRERKPRVRIAT